MNCRICRVQRTSHASGVCLECRDGMPCVKYTDYKKGDIVKGMTVYE